MTTKLVTELRTHPYRKNSIINGNFEFWQRGTSHANTGFGSADRWAQWYEGGTTCTISQQSFTTWQTEVPNNPRYYLRLTPAGVAGYGNIYQTIEGVESHSDETITMSFWAKASVAGTIIQPGWTQKFGSGGTPSGRVDGGAELLLTLTTSWKKYTVLMDIPSIEGKTLGTSEALDALYIYIAYAYSGNWPMPTGTIDISQIQVESGSMATEFEHRLFSEELALCQRYYETGWVFFIGHANAINGLIGGYATYATKKAKGAVVTLSATEDVNLNTIGLYQSDHGFRVHSNVTAAGNAYYSATFSADADQG